LLFFPFSDIGIAFLGLSETRHWIDHLVPGFFLALPSELRRALLGCQLVHGYLILNTDWVEFSIRVRHSGLGNLAFVASGRCQKTIN
tara:strand:+ start:247 stop:507 length:261 start_codon:yes stop_codon:yes gene_type:complete